MFCASLRRRSSFNPVLKLLALPSGLALKENQLSTHDISLPLSQPAHPTQSSQQPKRTLRILLLSPNSLTPATLHATLLRIEHFAVLTGGLDIAIILLLSAPQHGFQSAKQLTSSADDSNGNSNSSTIGVRAYALLQSTLLTHTGLPNIPILPLATLDALPDQLKAYAADLCRGRPKQQSAVRSIDLLAQCTLEASLSPFARDLASDAFSSLAEVAGAATRVLHGKTKAAAAAAGDEEWMSSGSQVGKDLEGFALLSEQVGDEVVDGMVEFWAEEWAAE